MDETESAINRTSPGNGSSGNGEYKFVVADHLPYVILSILIALMNIFVILLFAFKRNLRKPHNYLLISLSVSDLLTGLVGLPLILVCSTTPNCVSCIFSFTFVVFTSISTVLHILVISYERYMKIVFPFKMQRIGSMCFELKVIAILWLTSVLVPPIPLSWSPLTEEACHTDDDESDANKNKIFNILLVTVFVGIPLLLLIYADVSVFFVVRRQLDGIDKTSVGFRDSRKRIKKESRVVAMIAVMMIYFVICWSFYYTAIIMHSIGEDLLIPDWLGDVVDVLRCTTPLVNPILYVLLKHDFRRAIGVEIKRIKNKYSHEKVDQTNRLSNETATVCRTSSRNITERTVFLTTTP